MTKLHLVWNGAKNECVGFLDKRDADYTATGGRKYLESPYAVPTIGEAFRESHGEDAKRRPQTTVEI